MNLALKLKCRLVVVVGERDHQGLGFGKDPVGFHRIASLSAALIERRLNRTLTNPTSTFQGVKDRVAPSLSKVDILPLQISVVFSQ
jgi:hypothetical protein